MAMFKRQWAFWLVLYILWSYMKSNGTFWRPVLYFNVINVAIYMGAYYLLRNYQLPKLYNKGKKVQFVLSILVASFGFYFIWRVVGVFWHDAVYYPNRKLPFMTMVNYLTQAVQFYSPSVLLLAWEFYHQRQKEALRIEQLEKEKIAAELKFLKAQINPHFLFNTLNNLYSFVINQSPKAPDMIMHLSDMLEYVLYKSQQKRVPLKQETACIENFIELEKMRYGERLTVDYHSNGDLSLPVSPLILLSIVENAFKHGASGDVNEPKIKIKILTEENFIHCEVWNTKSIQEGELNDAYKKGIGLSNIKQQLRLIYPESHELKIEDKPDSFNLNLTINTAA